MLRFLGAISVVATCLLSQAPGLANGVVDLNPAQKEKFAAIQEGWLTLKSEKPARVLIQRNGPQCRVHILDGTVNVRNAIDKSVLRLGTGAVYQSQLKENWNEPFVAGSENAEDLVDHAGAIPIFETAKCTTVLFRLKDQKDKFKAEVISPPSSMNYEIGPTVGVPPHLVREFPPVGIMHWRDTAQAVAGQQNPQ